MFENRILLYNLVFILKYKTKTSISCRRWTARLEMCTGMGMVEILQNPRVSHWYGYECCGSTMGMDLVTAGFPQGWILL